MFIVETEYLFVNLKWNQIPETEDIEHREPIQIGIVAADENLQKEKIFSKAIRLSDPTHINKDALKLYRTTLENIMNANTKEDIFGRVVRTFPTYKYIVTWNKNIYSLFKYTMKQCGFSMRRHTVIILQDILSIVASDGKRKIGFSQAIPDALQMAASYLEYVDAEIDEAIIKETQKEAAAAMGRLIGAVNEEIEEIYRYAKIEIHAQARALESMMNQDGYVDPDFKIR